MVRYNEQIRGDVRADAYTITVNYPGQQRQFVGFLYSLNWELEESGVSMWETDREVQSTRWTTRMILCSRVNTVTTKWTTYLEQNMFLATLSQQGAWLKLTLE